MFLNPKTVENFLANQGDQGLSKYEASALMKSALKISNMFFDVDNLRLKLVTCDPGKLAQFLKSDDMGAIYELSKALCSLDVSEISDLVKVIHENVDIAGLLNKTETVANKTINYDSYRDELILRQRNKINRRG